MISDTTSSLVIARSVNQQILRLRSEQGLPRFARNDSGGKARNDTPSFVIARYTSAEAISHTPRDCHAEPVLSEILRYAQNDKGKLGVRMTESEGARNDKEVLLSVINI